MGIKLLLKLLHSANDGHYATEYEYGPKEPERSTHNRIIDSGLFLFVKKHRKGYVEQHDTHYYCHNPDKAAKKVHFSSLEGTNVAPID